MFAFSGNTKSKTLFLQKKPALVRFHRGRVSRIKPRGHLAFSKDEFTRVCYSIMAVSFAKAAWIDLA
jgi:hypothetical protein